MPLQKKEWTPAKPTEVRAALQVAWKELFDTELPEATLRLLLALWSLETAQGQHMYNYNLGNIIAVGELQDYWVGDDSGNTRKFRAWGDLAQGAAGLVLQLTSATRPEWQAGLLTGDPHEFVRALKGLNGGASYFEAEFDVYLSAFIRWWHQYGGDSPPAQTVSLGDHGVQVMLVQALVNSALPPWADRLVVDGAFGSETAAYVRLFQTQTRLKTDALVGPETWRSLLWVGGYRWMLAS